MMSLESFIEGGPPVVWCEGETKDFIMRIRTEPLEVSYIETLVHIWPRTEVLAPLASGYEARFTSFYFLHCVATVI